MPGLTRKPVVGDRFTYQGGDRRFDTSGTIVRLDGTIAYYDDDRPERNARTRPEDRCFIWGFGDGSLNKLFTLVE